jgi:hypothetical protein
MSGLVQEVIKKDQNNSSSRTLEESAKQLKLQATIDKALKFVKAEGQKARVDEDQKNPTKAAIREAGAKVSSQLSEGSE